MLKRSLPWVLLLVYAAILFKVMVLKEIPTIRIGHMIFRFSGAHEGAPNFMPFRTIALYLKNTNGMVISGINLLGNIGLLVPVGFLLPFSVQGMNWRKGLFWAIISGLLIETLQVILHVGIFDIDDVILNGLGVMLGYGSQVLFVRLFHTTTSRALALAAAAVIMIITVYLTVRAMQGGRKPVRPDYSAMTPIRDGDSVNSDRPNPTNDPCRGTGGTGRIEKLEGMELTIKRRDGVSQVIHLTPKTRFNSSFGAAYMADLKAGTAVTIVTDPDSGVQMTAVLVLICGGK